jgi:hemerythrin-like domain-containing protein
MGALAALDRVPRTIEQLQLDHRNMTRLLGLLRSELEASRAGETLDFDLLGSIMEYTLHYPDLFHHPKEDRVYRRMQLRDSTAAGRVGDLLKEHAHLADLTRQLAAALRNRANDVEMPRRWFENLMETYIAANQRHIAEEERVFFPLALVALSDADWAELDDQTSGASDPLFGGKLAGEYRRLHERIMRLAV